MEFEKENGLGVVTVEKPAKPRRAWGAAVALFFTAPLVAEFLLGNLPVTLLPALIVLAPMYGGGALLIREWVRRTGRGWWSILLLGMAYGIFEEAFTTQSLFNPDYLHMKLGLLGPGYIPALGIGGWWTLWMLNVHALWSISTPIALIEACVPDRARTPWLGKAGLAIVTVVFLLGAVGSTLIGYKQDRFTATPMQFAGAAVVVLLLIVAAFSIPAGRADAKKQAAASPWLLGAVALVIGSATLLIPMTWGWGAAATLLGLDAAMLVVVMLWQRRGEMLLTHQVAMGAGAALAYGWHAFLQHPAVGPSGTVVRVGNAVFLAGAIGLIWMGAKRASASTKLTEG